jgi:hypothetical protein
MNQWAVTNPWVFFGVSGLVVGYVLLMMVMRRKGARSGAMERDREL